MDRAESEHQLVSSIHVSDTAWILAELRAMESERPDALFQDTLARKLSGKKGKDLLARFPINDFYFLTLVRTKVIDELIYQLVESQSDVILNLAAGLDTRPYRLDLPRKLRWIEVDYPNVVQYKNEILTEVKPHCQLERLPADLDDDQARLDLLRKVGGEMRLGTVITEGILEFLIKENVVGLSLDLQAQKSIKWWIMSVTAPTLTTWLLGRVASQVPHAKLPGIQYDGVEIFLAHGWEMAAFHNYTAEGQRLKRNPPSTWPREVTAALKESGVALLKRSE
jgi:methyltransferase (TIGR00027 family)